MGQRKSRQRLKRADLDARAFLWHGTVETLLDQLPRGTRFDLLLTSPPYNLGKEYETSQSLSSYLKWQGQLIPRLVRRLKEGGSLCWQVGNFVENGSIRPLDILVDPLFRSQGLSLRNRIIWRFGHGLHTRKRFSGRYEVILWYTKGDDYTFNLDAVRVPPKYPGKRYYKGPRVGELSSNPLGKNPEDVWEFQTDFWNIPNVKANHVEKTIHPCQFPVGLAERLVLALSNERDTVFDPFMGVGTAGVAALKNERRFVGSDVSQDYVDVAEARIAATLDGTVRYRPHDVPVYDHRLSPLSRNPSLRDAAE